MAKNTFVAEVTYKVWQKKPQFLKPYYLRMVSATKFSKQLFYTAPIAQKLEEITLRKCQE